jgi:hypothetical protein
MWSMKIRDKLRRRRKGRETRKQGSSRSQLVNKGEGHNSLEKVKEGTGGKRKVYFWLLYSIVSAITHAIR